MITEIGQVIWPSNPEGGFVIAVVIAIVIILNLNSITDMVLRKVLPK